MSQHKYVHPAEKAHSAVSGVILADKIRFRAYELYQQRGGEEGHAIEHWLRAEEEIGQHTSSRKAA